MKKKRLVLIVSGIALIALAILWAWPFSSYNLSKVHPRIQSLKQPYQNVFAGFYLDGGSVGVKITDKDGQVLQLAVPVHDGPGEKQKYHRLYLGATHASDTNAVEVPFTEDTRHCLIDIIERNTEGMDRDAALISLRGAPRDYIRAFTRMLLRKNQP